MRTSCSVSLLLLCLLAPTVVAAQTLEMQRQIAVAMLDKVRKRIEKEFYDPNLKGIDLEPLYQEAKQVIEQANNLPAMNTVIYNFTRHIDDSHTYFISPPWTPKLEFGFEAKPFDQTVRVFRLDDEGAARRAGVQLGDVLLSINGFVVDRESFDYTWRFFSGVNPYRRLTLRITRGGETPRDIVVSAKQTVRSARLDLTSASERIREAENWAEKYNMFYYGTLAGQIGYLMLPEFPEDRAFITRLVDRIDPPSAMVIDLRGCRGGYLKTLLFFAGMFSSSDDIMGTEVGRKKSEPLEIKPKNPHFDVPLVILVDSESFSGAEAFAYHFQRTGQGIVVGDHTQGQLTISKVFDDRVGAGPIYYFGTQVAISRFVFPDGVELEGAGVTPDYSCIPSEADLREERDPCRDLAVQLALQKVAGEEPAASVEDR